MMENTVFEPDNPIFNLSISIIEVVVSIISIFINLLVIHILVRRMRLVQSDTVVSFLLCLIDILFSTYSTLNFIVLRVKDHHIFHQSVFYCQVNGFMFNTACVSIVQAITILGALRYMAICHGKIYSNRFWVVFISGLIVFNVIVGMYSMAESLFNMYPSGKFCGYGVSNLLPNILFNFFGAVVFVCLILIICFYLRIGSFYHKYINEMKKNITGFIPMHPKDSIECKHTLTSQELVADQYKVENNLKSSLIKLYFMLAVYTLELLPYLVIQAVFRYRGEYPPLVYDNIVSFIVHLMPLTNPLFILFFHEETNQELKAMFIIMWYRIVNLFKYK